MKIIDTTAISHIFKENIFLEDTYFITPCISDEMVTTEIVYDKKAPTNVKNIFEENSFDQALYVKNYFEMLNKHGDRSFFNMSGLGDISIIALVKTLVEMEKSATQTKLPFLEYKEEIIVYTSDNPLKTKIESEVGTKVKVLLPTDL
ncbi:MAG: hypothetical protein KBC12_00775 [Candidatus Pacebacteria bacterium]|nr:hypothetical protein [Candidatus Paceibacterota bacterium]